jgi:hypothetical protein
LGNGNKYKVNLIIPKTIVLTKKSYIVSPFKKKELVRFLTNKKEASPLERAG